MPASLEVELRNEAEIDSQRAAIREFKNNSELERDVKIVKPTEAGIQHGSPITKKLSLLIEAAKDDTNKADKALLRKYVKIRSDLFQTYGIVGAFFSAIGITVYYDSVGEEWIPLRAAYLAENGYSLNRSAIEVSKVFACVGVLHSILAIIIIVIGVIYTTHLFDFEETANFMINSRIWFLGWDSWDMNLAKIANINLSAALMSLFVAACADTYNRLDNPYTYIVGAWAVPVVGYISYLVYVSKKNWDAKHAKVVGEIHSFSTSLIKKG